MNTEYRGKKLKDIAVNLSLEDGTELKCGVYAYFVVNNKDYFALQALTPDGFYDTTVSLMIYEVIEDEEHNPVVVYIEDDNEFNTVAAYYQEHYLSEED